MIDLNDLDEAYSVLLEKKAREEAIDLLCEVLKISGFSKTVEMFRKIEKEGK